MLLMLRREETSASRVLADENRQLDEIVHLRKHSSQIGMILAVLTIVIKKIWREILVK